MRKIIQEISDLVGEEISAICFVRDYIEICFDGPILRSLSNPRVIIKVTEFYFPESGSRDALCYAIGSSVQKIMLNEHQALTLITDNDCQIVIPLDLQSLSCPESMHFVPVVPGPIQVWY